ncbi:hypothetical protein Pan241w_36960 [Gimesia alba]|uniref:Uncharacterized protein n=1 Tax=Gimesia alba TaxID=2527973 RepID=A0A517RI83_9PLAN|nr:hypothetical protein [Gimesia alba]QDT43594.1 hypothetical protein Pan241w_36960 [Gimesia alba]
MSRQITIGYQEANRKEITDIEIQAPYFLFGTQQTSKRFWSLPDWERIGIKHLSELGESDPIYFIGWDMMADLSNEIGLLQDNLDTIEFYPEIKAEWLAHLIYCYHLLVMTAPRTSIPSLGIG